MTQIIGVDPGPDTGILSLFPHDNTVTIRALQVDSGSVIEALLWLHELANARKHTKTVIAHERYVLRPGSHKVKDQSANQVTRDLNGQIAALHQGVTTPIPEIVVVETRAVDVKAWASEDRLKATPVWRITKGMRHARSAAWHALHVAVFRCGWPDPAGLHAGAPWVPGMPPWQEVDTTEDVIPLAPHTHYRIEGSISGSSRPPEYGANFRTHHQVWR
jgi:hypothetical protein